MSVPMPTTARRNSGTPSWRSASSSVASACTTWVSSVGPLLDQLEVLVDAEHLVAEPDAVSSATWPPKRPRPMTTTLSLARVLPLSSQRSVAPLDSGRAGAGCCSASAEATAIVPTRPTNIEHDQDDLRGRRQRRRDAGGQADRGERRGRLEQRLLERDRTGGGQEASVPAATSATPSSATVSACRCTALGDPAAADDDVRLAPDLGPDDVGEQEERGHLDAAGGARAAAADEHERDRRRRWSPVRMAPKSTLVKPPERGIAPWMKAARIFSPTPSGPNVFGLVHSKPSITTKPTTSSADGAEHGEPGVGGPQRRVGRPGGPARTGPGSRRCRR